MKTLLLMLSIVILAATPVTTVAKSKNEPPEYTVEGLKLVPNTKLALVYAEEGADLSQYERVYITEPFVAFKKNWQRDQNRGTLRVSKSDMDRIKKGVAEIFMDVFTAELTKGGYSLANERAEDVLLVKPAIIDLDVKAPDLRSAGRTESYTQSAGSMTLYIELYDSETDDLLAKGVDHRAERDRGYMQWQTQIQNRVAAKKMMQPWAEALRTGLDDARHPDNQN